MLENLLLTGSVLLLFIVASMSRDGRLAGPYVLLCWLIGALVAGVAGATSFALFAGAAAALAILFARGLQLQNFFRRGQAHTKEPDNPK